MIPAAVAIGFFNMDIVKDEGKIKDFVLASLCKERRPDKLPAFAEVKADDDF